MSTTYEDLIAKAGGAKLSQLLGGFAAPHRKFSIALLRANMSGAPVTVNAAFAVRALTTGDEEDAHAEAIKFLLTKGAHQREDLIGDSGDSVLRAELMVQLMARALVDPDKPTTPVGDAGLIRGLLFADELEVCFREYLDFQAERSPIRSLRTRAELDEVIAALGKGRTGEINLQRFDVVSLCSMVRTLAVSVATLTRPNSSDTSPPNESQTTSSETGSEKPPITISED